MNITSVTIIGRQAPNIEIPFAFWSSITFWLYIALSFAYCFCSFSICGRTASIISDCFFIFIREKISNGRVTVFKMSVKTIIPTPIMPIPSISH